MRSRVRLPLLEVVKDGFEFSDAVGLELPALEVEEEADRKGEARHAIAQIKGLGDFDIPVHAAGQVPHREMLPQLACK